MRLNLKILILFAVTTQLHFLSLHADGYEEKITKVNDSFYVGKIKDKQLWAVMEKVTSGSVFSEWAKYAQVQNHPTAVKFGRVKAPNFTEDGSKHFKMVTTTTNYVANELWIAFITTNSNPTPTTAGAFDNYKPEDVRLNLSDGHPRAKDILMYVSVSSSPKAIITSHMGVSSSIEGLQKRQPQISMDLHSFAAKVMKMLNRDRRLMVNAPVIGMEKIIALSVPNDALFVGTKEMKKLVDERAAVTFAEFMRKHPNILAETKTSITESAERLLKRATSNLENLEKTIPTDADDERFLNEDKEKSLKLIARAKANLATVDENALEKVREEYARYQTPYPFDGINELMTLKQVQDKFPPILSVNSSDGRTLDTEMTIYNPSKQDEPLITIFVGNNDYQWLFTSPFQAAGETHYIAVDLAALANARELE